mgnify:CR=1 FL=1
MENSNINHPSHYNVVGRKECIVEIQEKYGIEILITFCLTNAYKYLYRAGNKENNSYEQDIQKAQWYFDYIKNYMIINDNLVELYKYVKTELEKTVYAKS